MCHIFHQVMFFFDPTVVLLFLPILAYVLYLFVSDRPALKYLGLCLGVYPVIVIYVLNPNWRLYSYHGLLHSVIHFEILSGHIPPSMPFMAGEPMLYNWGYECVSALVALALHLPPSLCFAPDQYRFIVALSRSCVQDGELP